MKYQIILTQQFGMDFEDAIDYLKGKSQTVALNFTKVIEKRIKMLETFPEIGKNADDERLRGLQFLIITKYNYIVIYEVDHRQKIVYLLNLFHGKRDIPTLYLKLKK